MRLMREDARGGEERMRLLVGRLPAALEAPGQVSKELERRVAERTAELSEANASLTKHKAPAPSLAFSRRRTSRSAPRPRSSPATSSSFLRTGLSTHAPRTVPPSASNGPSTLSTPTGGTRPPRSCSTSITRSVPSHTTNPSSTTSRRWSSKLWRRPERVSPPGLFQRRQEPL
jgi:hypothetical protein